MILELSSPKDEEPSMWFPVFNLGLDSIDEQFKACLLGAMRSRLSSKLDQYIGTPSPSSRGSHYADFEVPPRIARLPGGIIFAKAHEEYRFHDITQEVVLLMVFAPAMTLRQRA